MRYAPEPNDDEIGTREDDIVADPLADRTLDLWNNTARTNREIFTEVFRPVPTNLVRSWSAYEASNQYPRCLFHVFMCQRSRCTRDTAAAYPCTSQGSVVECPLVRPWYSVTKSALA